MWDIVGTIAAIVLILLLFDVLEIAEGLTDRLRGRVPRKDLERKLSALEKRIDHLEKIASTSP